MLQTGPQLTINRLAAFRFALIVQLLALHESQLNLNEPFLKIDAEWHQRKAPLGNFPNQSTNFILM